MTFDLCFIKVIYDYHCSSFFEQFCIPNVHVDIVQSFKMVFCEIFLIPARDLTSSCFIRLDITSEL